MLIQILTVDRSKRPAAALQDLIERLRARGHEVVVHRFAAAKAYVGRSAGVEAVLDAIWTNKRGCFQYAQRHNVPYTLVLQDDCELDDLDGIDVAESFVRTHEGPVDLFFLGASPNCWWTGTEDRRVVKYSHVYWWHAVVFTTSFIERHEQPRTWTGANDIHMTKLVASGEIAAFGLRRQVAFQCDRRNRFAERVLYAWPWGDGRWLAAMALFAVLAWIGFRTVR
jgi:hypothetical protein